MVRGGRTTLFSFFLFYGSVFFFGVRSGQTAVGPHFFLGTRGRMVDMGGYSFRAVYDSCVFVCTKIWKIVFQVFISLASLGPKSPPFLLGR